MIATKVLHDSYRLLSLRLLYCALIYNIYLGEFSVIQNYISDLGTDYRMDIF